MTLQQLLDEGSSCLLRAGVPDSELDAKYLLLDTFRLDLVHFLLERNQEIKSRNQDQDAVTCFRKLVERRSKRVPLQHLLGSQEFMGMEFLVNEQVLIPRQDTETLVERILKDGSNADLRVLDLCTGSGCIAISLALLGEYGHVIATDLSPGALAVAWENANRLILQRQLSDNAERDCLELRSWEDVQAVSPIVKVGNLELRRSDLYAELSEFKEKGCGFDLIVSNPPYIETAVIEGLEPEVREHEPMSALDGGEDGLSFYRRLAAESGAYLNPGGRIYLEIGCDQAETVSRPLHDYGYTQIEVIKDEPGLDRVVKATRL